MGHTGGDASKQLSMAVDCCGDIKGVDKVMCDICVLGKQSCLPHRKTRERTKRPLERVHRDVC